MSRHSHKVADVKAYSAVTYAANFIHKSLHNCLDFDARAWHDYLINKNECATDAHRIARKAMIDMATMNTTEVAADFGTTPRELRKFLRSPEGTDSKVGKGARWSIEKRDLRSLRSKFSKWVEAREAAKADEAPETDIADEAPEVLETDES